MPSFGQPGNLNAQSIISTVDFSPSYTVDPCPNEGTKKKFFFGRSFCNEIVTPVLLHTVYLHYTAEPASATGLKARNVLLVTWETIRAANF